MFANYLKNPAFNALIYSLIVAGPCFGAKCFAATQQIQVRDQNGAPLAGAVVVIPNQATPTRDLPNRFVMDQVNRQFQPRVLVIPVGGVVEFPNSDDVLHHVYSFSDAKTFELRLYHADEADPVSFDQAGIVTIGCNIHDNMRAYILVTEHSVFGLTDSAGVFRLPPLNADLDNIEVWHPQLEQILTFPVTDDENIFSVTLPVVPTVTESVEQKSTLEERLKRYKRNAQ